MSGCGRTGCGRYWAAERISAIPCRMRISTKDFCGRGRCSQNTGTETEPLRAIFRRETDHQRPEQSGVVVEAREKSGSLITADFALEQGKDVFAVPGRATDPMSAGCNRLIDQGAGIVCSVEDYVRQLFEGLGAMPGHLRIAGESGKRPERKAGRESGRGKFSP